MIVTFPTQTLDCDSYSSARLNIFISSNPYTCFIVTFPRLGNSNLVIVLISTDFLSNSKLYVPFYRTALNILSLTGMAFMII